jgi:hypothetical protein
MGVCGSLVRMVIGNLYPSCKIINLQIGMRTERGEFTFLMDSATWNPPCPPPTMTNPLPIWSNPAVDVFGGADEFSFLTKSELAVTSILPFLTAAWKQ